MTDMGTTTLPAANDKHRRYLLRWLSLYAIPYSVYMLGFVPAIGILKVATLYLPFGRTWWDIILIPAFITFELGIVILSQFLISGGCLRLFRVCYADGTYQYDIADPMTYKWMLVCSLYTPFRKLSEIIPLGPIKKIYLRLLGMTIGEHTLIGGTIKDPCLTKLGDNVTIGEYAVLYAHIQDLQRGTIAMSTIRVGNNCVIGAGAIIMPGVTIEDNVIVAAGSLVPKNHVLKKGKVYAGNPAKEHKSPSK